MLPGATMKSPVVSKLISDPLPPASKILSSLFPLVFSTTNPSLVPFETMGCGLAVADLNLEDSVVNYGDIENVFLLDPMPEKMAEQIAEALRNDELRRQRSENGRRYVERTFPDDEGMGRRIESLIKDKIRPAAIGVGA